MALHSSLTGVSQLHKTLVESNAGDPSSSVTPTATGQLLWDSTNNKLYRATGATSADWVQCVGQPRHAGYAGMPSAVPTTGATSPFTFVTKGSGATTTAVVYPGFALGSPSLMEISPYHVLSDEDDGSGRFTSYASMKLLDNHVYASGPLTLTLRAFMPPTFVSGGAWGANGIRIQTKYVGDGSSAAGLATFGLEVYEPTTGTSYSTPEKVTRTVTATTSETSYTWLGISGASLGGLFLPGDPLVIVLSCGHASAGAGLATEFRFGKLEVNWNG